MKKFTLVIMALLALAFTVKAQQYVSTEPSNRNVILEEFTGRGCQFCPDGHRIANEIAASNPGRFWAINVHAGNYALTSYPNFVTPDGNTIHGGFTISGYPTGVVNRSTAAGQSRSAWPGLTNTQLNQASECNIAGRVTINPETRMANFIVEVYYTGNSAYDENYLTVAMLQDSIMGSQTGMNANPSQVVNGTYCHMHVLRDVITSSAWGDPISPTTQGTLITRTYEYQIPETIGNPGGVEVVLDHIFFLAWVSERQQGSAYRPILTGCELEKTMMTDEPIYPKINTVSQAVKASCGPTQTFNISLSNIGTSELTSIKFNAEAGGVTEEFEWNGNLPSGDKANVEFTMDLPLGTYNGTLNITEANGEPFEAMMHFAAESLEWITVSEETTTTSLKVIVIQDQYGEQITWDIINSNGDVVASGGPYQHLAGSGTQIRPHNVDNLPVNECYLFRIHDSNGDGICCNYGNGYYQIKDAHNNVIAGGQGSGDFGDEAKQLISITNPSAVTVATMEPKIIGDHEALFTGTVDGTCDEVGFEYKKLENPTPHTVQGQLSGKTFTATVDDLESNKMYSVKAYAIVGGNKVYGQSIDFHTGYEGVSELENTLKVFPNPASETLTVEGNITSVEVYNTVGQCLLTKQVNGNTQIDLAGLGNGIYFLRVYNNGAVAVRKFSVNR